RCFPLPPQSRSQSQSDPSGERYQHQRRFAEAEVGSPTPQIRSQFLHCRLHAHALRSSRDVSDSLLKAIQGLRRNSPLDLWTGGKAESEKLALLRSRHRTLRLVYLELEPVCDEARNALHHPLTGALAANVDIAVVRIANKAESPTLQLSVEFVEHEIAE